MLKRFTRARGGNFMVTTALLAPVFLGLAGLAMDFSIFYSQRAQMRETADLAALAAVREAGLQGWDHTIAEASAEAFVEETLGMSAMSSAVYSSDVSVDQKSKTVTVTIRQDGHGYLLLGFVKSNPQIEVSTTAAMANSTNLCLIALHDKGGSTFRMDGKATLAAKGCGLFANSTDAKAVDIAAGSKIAADLVCSAGGYSGQPADIDPDPTTDCPTTPDPLAKRP